VAQSEGKGACAGSAPVYQGGTVVKEELYEQKKCRKNDALEGK
jgi:hypothetical protein